ncbi:tetratricopeptide repeat protein [Dehalococcoidia bacterium]|nr:tetratricopeptide repeat protein [Dehalococcoidia bacterium]
MKRVMQILALLSILVILGCSSEPSMSPTAPPIITPTMSVQALAEATVQALEVQKRAQAMITATALASLPPTPTATIPPTSTPTATATPTPPTPTVTPGPQETAQSYVTAGNRFMLTAEYTAALENYKSAIGFDPQSATANLGLCHVNNALNYSIAATESCGNAISLDPENAEAYAQRGHAYLSREKFTEAMHDFDTALNLDSDNVTALYGRGFTRYILENFVTTTEDLQAAILLDEPLTAINYVTRGRATYILLFSLNIDDAIDDFNEAIKLDPTYAPAFLWRGKTHLHQKNYEEAVADFTTSLKLDPNHPNLTANLSFRSFAKWHLAIRELRLTGELSESNFFIEDYEQAIRVKPGSMHAAEAYVMRAEVHQTLKNFSAASRDLDTAARLRPSIGNTSTYWALKGLGKTSLGHHADAIGMLDKSIELEPDWYYSYQVRGDAKLALGQCSAGIADYDQSLALVPDNSVLIDKRENAAARLTLFNNSGASASTCVS